MQNKTLCVKKLIWSSVQLICVHMVEGDWRFMSKSLPFHALWPIATIWRRWIGHRWLRQRIAACLLTSRYSFFIINLDSSGPIFSEIWITMKIVHSEIISIWGYRLQNGCHFVQASPGSNNACHAMLAFYVTEITIFLQQCKFNGTCCRAWTIHITHRKHPEGRLNKKDGLTRYGNSHVKDKTS